MAKLKKKKQHRFNRGYDIFHKSYNSCQGRNALANCFSCKYFFQADGDTSEYCQNRDVLKYDVVVADNRVFCGYWKGVWQ